MNIMKLKEIRKDIYDVSSYLDEVLGKEGSPERERNRQLAWEEYEAQVRADARRKELLKTDE